MHSSISNSKTAKHQWLRTWFLTALLLLFILTVYETYLIQEDYQPSIEVGENLWSWNRSHIQHNPSAIALVGASRIQLGVNTEVMQAELNEHQIVPLAINGQYPMATLKGLAEDETFNGLVIMSFMAQMLEPQYVEMQTQYNHYFKNQSSWYLSFDAHLTALLKSNLRFMHPLLGLKEVVKHWSAKRNFAGPFYVSILPDTSGYGDYSLVDIDPLKAYFIEQKEINYQSYSIMDADTWLTQLESLADDVDAIQSRGGEVVLVRFPTDDEHWNLDEAYYPRAKYWQVMVETIPQLKTIHFKDDVVLRSFALPDSSHLDQTDTGAFTLRLIELIRNMQSVD